jgi:hypothetical protein
MGWTSCFLLLCLTEGRHVPNAAECVPGAVSGQQCLAKGCAAGFQDLPGSRRISYCSTCAEGFTGNRCGECFDAKNNFISKFPFCSSCPRPLKTAQIYDGYIGCRQGGCH